MLHWGDNPNIRMSERPELPHQRAHYETNESIEAMQKLIDDMEKEMTETEEKWKAAGSPKDSFYVEIMNRGKAEIEAYRSKIKARYH